MMMWRSLKAGTILAALKPSKTTAPSQKQTADTRPAPQPKPAH